MLELTPLLDRGLMLEPTPLLDLGLTLALASLLDQVPMRGFVTFEPPPTCHPVPLLDLVPASFSA